MSATRYAVAHRPGRSTCWHVVSLATAAPVGRYIIRAEADRHAGLLDALANELDAIETERADVDDRPGADFEQCHEHGIGCPCRIGGPVMP